MLSFNSFEHLCIKRPEAGSRADLAESWNVVVTETLPVYKRRWSCDTLGYKRETAQGVAPGQAHRVAGLLAKGRRDHRPRVDRLMMTPPRVVSGKPPRHCAGSRLDGGRDHLPRCHA